LALNTTTATAQALFLRPSCGKTYNAQANKPVEIQYGAWGSNGAELAEENAKHLTVQLIVDNHLVSDQRRFTAAESAIPCGNVPAGPYWIVHTTWLDSFSPGKHTLKVIYTFDHDVTDGYDSDKDGALDRYAADKPLRQTYTVLVP
jgi:hypothetical protein